jgi:HlyD family secretion protein
MDRELPDTARRRARLGTVARIGLPSAAVVAMVVLLPGWMRPAIARVDVRTAVVQAGPIDAVVTAAGTVMPAVERILSSPVDARLLRILKRPGSTVTTGEPVAELDLTDTQLAIDRVARDLAISRNKQDQTRLALDKALADVDARIERKTLDVELLEAKAANSARLAEAKLASAHEVREARLAAQAAAIDLAQLRRERDGARQSTALQSEGLSLEYAALEKEAAAARRTLDLATTRSDRDGVVTWTLTQEGALVRRGEVVARIADLRSFRVDATISDIHSGRVRAGMPVNVAANDVVLDGTIAEVSPSVDQGAIRFTVALREPSHTVLRPNMRVDVHVVTDRRPRALTVKLGPFVTGPDRSEAFVIRGDRAVRTTVGFGLRGADTIEVSSGLGAGDEVVISDMRNYLHLEQLEVR